MGAGELNGVRAERPAAQALRRVHCPRAGEFFKVEDTVMAPGEFQEVTALDRNSSPVSMGFIPTWRPVSLLDRIQRKDSHG